MIKSMGRKMMKEDKGVKQNEEENEKKGDRNDNESLEK